MTQWQMLGIGFYVLTMAVLLAVIGWGIGVIRGTKRKGS
jgi:hypothetical protein